jgi:hypothetical protein
MKPQELEDRLIDFALGVLDGLADEGVGAPGVL